MNEIVKKHKEYINLAKYISHLTFGHSFDTSANALATVMRSLFKHHKFTTENRNKAILDVLEQLDKEHPEENK
jgi:hypothetical protein